MLGGDGANAVPKQELDRVLTQYHHGVTMRKEVAMMVRYTIRMSDELHEKIRWLAYQERRSQHEIMLEALERALKDVKVPEEGLK